MEERLANRDRGRGWGFIAAAAVLAFCVVIFSIFLALGGSRRSPTEKPTEVTLQALAEIMSQYQRSHPEPTAGGWQAALESDVEAGKMLKGLPQEGGKIVDGYGGGIEYVPSEHGAQKNRPGYFVSAGADGVMGSEDDVYGSSVSAQQ
jgi:hypothetical protein